MRSFKFCAGCQTLRDESNGKKVVRGKATRWMCQTCLDKKNVTVYGKKQKVSGK
jgi:hypothetical protein